MSYNIVSADGMLCLLRVFYGDAHAIDLFTVWPYCLTAPLVKNYHEFYMNLENNYFFLGLIKFYQCNIYTKPNAGQTRSTQQQ